MTSRLALHMVEALPLRSVWVGRKPPRNRPSLWRGWMTIAVLTLASTGLAVAVSKILRAAL